MSSRPMALWQTSFLFLPQSLVGDYDEIPLDVFERWQDGLEAAAPDFVLPSDYEMTIAHLLPQAKG
jgi:hypothetical protein